MALPHDPVVDLIPDKGYFRHYHDMTKGSEICPRFHFFTAATVLGAAIARKVKFQRSSSDVFPPLYPNPWVILVAPQGMGHKTAALGVGRKMLTRMPPHMHPRILSSKLTPEALVKALTIDEPKGPTGIAQLGAASKPCSTGLIYSTELGVLLGREKYNQGMIALLTELYDCQEEWTSATIMRGDQKLYNVALSLLGASTPDWMQSMLPPDAFKGGFMSRLLLVSLPVGWEKVRVADPPKGDQGSRDLIVSEMERIAAISGTMKWTNEAKQFFTDWYMSIERETVVGPIMAYLERKQDHMLRFAMLLELSITYENLILTRECLEQSLNILTMIEKETAPMVEFLATEPRMRTAQYILEILRTQPKGVAESKLLQQVWRGLGYPNEFDQIMAMLLKARSIKIQGVVNKEIVYEQG